jgi:hypothetical protein
VYATFQSEIQKNNKETVFLFDSLENYGLEKTSMRTLEYEIVHAVSFPQLQEYYEQELIPLHSSISQDNSHQANFQRLIKPNQNCLMNKRIVLIYIIWLSCLKMFTDI